MLVTDNTIEIYGVLTVCRALWVGFIYISSFDPYQQLYQCGSNFYHVVDEGQRSLGKLHTLLKVLYSLLVNIVFTLNQPHFRDHKLYCDAINIIKENNLNAAKLREDPREQREFLDKLKKWVPGARVVTINEAWQKCLE